MGLAKLLFSFRGRINRARFWLALLVYVVAAIIANGISFASESYTVSMQSGMAVFAFTAVSGILVAIKRLHDRNRSGWWVLPFYFGPGVVVAMGELVRIFGVMGDVPGLEGLGYLLDAAGIAFLIWTFLEFACLRGTVGPNRYGPDPLAVPGQS
jgi:uncharacterized membrane protein YhaH (DUF805 family)